MTRKDIKIIKSLTRKTHLGIGEKAVCLTSLGLTKEAFLLLLIKNGVKSKDIL